MRDLADILRESDFHANAAGHVRIEAADVDRAIAAREARQSRIRERLREEMQKGTLLIATDGERVGQVNGLSVVQLGDYLFGMPSRITARVRLGSGGVVDIEREAELGGPLHSKGVMILSGFLAGRYSTDRPLSLSATLVFEQNYGGVEGDSASCAELCALLSALADAPIRQSLAMTGSVNQHGDVQAIGGVNEKIEGFFDLCKARGLTGRQAVIIPAANVRHLMLRLDVVAAVAAGQFAVHGCLSGELLAASGNADLTVVGVARLGPGDLRLARDAPTTLLVLPPSGRYRGPLAAICPVAVPPEQAIGLVASLASAVGDGFTILVVGDDLAVAGSWCEKAGDLLRRLDGRGKLEIVRDSQPEALQAALERLAPRAVAIVAPP